MMQRYRKLLTALLALLVGLSPLQGALAAMVVRSDHGALTQHMQADRQAGGAVMSHAAQTSHGCTQCGDSGCCEKRPFTSLSCTSCTTAYLTSLYAIPEVPVTNADCVASKKAAEPLVAVLAVPSAKGLTSLL